MNQITECDIDAVKDKTHEYWDNPYDPDNRPPYYAWYINELLPLEMACAAEGYGILPKSPDKYKHLVILVGHSPEPLLQSVWAYQPEKVSLIVNKRYGKGITGQMQSCLLKNLIERLPHTTTVETFPFIDASPEDVFRVLLEELRDDVKDVIIDITGSKKSMVSGAYLFAAFANVPVSYVDFADDAYHPEKRRPYGYRCQIRNLNNPYGTFALRDWERVRNLYSRYKFRDARLLLAGNFQNGNYTGGSNTILEIMSTYLPESAEHIKILADVLRCYELWNSGDYREAKKLAGGIDKYQPPKAVDVLGENWYVPENGRFEGGFGDGLPKFYEDTVEFKAYILDELARIKRLIEFNHDYRSAIIRAGNLNENVMVARLVKMLPEGDTKETILDELQKKTPGAKSVFNALAKPVGTKINVKDEIWRRRFVPQTYEIHIAQEMDWYVRCNVFGTEGDWGNFIKVRDSLTHKYFSPPPDWAEDAYQFMRANIVDFWNLSEPEKEDVHALPWMEICEISGINDYLTPNLITNPEEATL